jgi:hypothetical protein
MFEELVEESSSDHSTNPKSSGQADHPQPNSPVQQPISPDQQQGLENPATSEQQSTPIQAEENIESNQLLITSSPVQGEQIPEGNPAEKVRLFCDQSFDLNILLPDELS